MRVVAALACYEEPAENIARLMGSLVGTVDELVAFCGRWELMPAATTDAWAWDALLLELQGEVTDGLAVDLHTGRGLVYESQVAKRDALMERAGERGDWIVVVDGDESVECANPAALRSALAETTLDVAEVTLRTLNRPWPFAHLAPMIATTRRIYRAGTRVVGPAHNDYARHGVRLNGDMTVGPRASALDLTGLVTIVHDNRARGVDRERAAQDYRRARRAHGVEVLA